LSSFPWDLLHSNCFGQQQDFVGNSELGFDSKIGFERNSEQGFAVSSKLCLEENSELNFEGNSKPSLESNSEIGSNSKIGLEANSEVGGVLKGSLKVVNTFGSSLNWSPTFRCSLSVFRSLLLRLNRKKARIRVSLSIGRRHKWHLVLSV